MKRFSILFFLYVFVFFVPCAFAVDMPSETPVPQKVEYALPYPGILADNPLYILKNLRDTIMEWLIADPVKRIEFHILQGDKNLNAGVFLDAKGNAVLAERAIVQGNKYMESSIRAAISLTREGREIPDYVIEKLRKSLAKHEEVITELFDKSAQDQKSNYEDQLGIIKGFASEAAILQR
jgi:hypothetical protein